MTSDLPRLTIRLEIENKLKLKFIADLEDRSVNREARRILLRYIAEFEEKNGEIDTEKMKFRE